VKHHPDKGGDPEIFNEIRDAYEILSDTNKRKWYGQGGVLLVKNMETAFKEVEGQEAQAMAQLDQQIPKNHPMRKQAEAQVRGQLPSKEQLEHQIYQKMTNDDAEIPVPVTLKEIFVGVKKKTFDFQRLVICRGCRHDPDSKECVQCGKCPAERRQIPKMQGPFQVGMKEVEMESAERCRHVPVRLEHRIPRGAPDGTFLGKVADVGHQTPGRLPGTIVLRTQLEADAHYSLVGSDLYTVLSLTLEEAMFGFKKSWIHLDDETEIKLESTTPSQPGQVLKLAKKGMFDSNTKKSGHMYVRLDIVLQKPTSDSLTVSKPAKDNTAAALHAEAKVEWQDGGAYRLWSEMMNAQSVGKDGKKKPSKNDEL